MYLETTPSFRDSTLNYKDAFYVEDGKANGPLKDAVIYEAVPDFYTKKKNTFTKTAS
jgi:predicted Zn-dependent protease